MSALRWLAPFVVVLLAAYFFQLAPQADELEAQRAMLARLKEEYVQKKKQAVNLDLLRAQMREIDTAFGHLLRALPNRIDREFADVLRAARSHNVRIEELRPEREEVTREFYAELGATLKASGRYHDLGRFSAALAGAPGSLLVQDVSLDPGPGAGRVTLSSSLRTFRYRDEGEIAAERKRMRALKGRKG